MLDVSNLSVHFGNRAILHGVDLVAKAGEVTAICGPNGAGKSTVLRAILGEVPCQGAVVLNGLAVGQTPTATLARQRAVLAQDTQVAFDFKVAEIVAMGQEAGDFSQTRDLVATALAAVGLKGFGPRAFATLSGGEKQRAHLARALAQVWQPVGPAGPRWLFLDEPVASLDLGQQLRVMQLARNFADAGGGVVAVMHDLNLSAMFADQIAFLLAGRISAFGTPEQVLTPNVLHAAYDCHVTMNQGPSRGPWFVPQSCRSTAQV